MEEKITVADFFCGAGGFSEGFRQAGCKIVLAVDNWEPARQTHNLNHPDCKHLGLDCHLDTKGDILLIHTEKINEIVDDVTVIIGSPPCISFSSSNRAGKADKSLGIKLIEKFLQIVAVKKYSPDSKLKYWIMENVPNSRKYLKSNYTFHSLGLNDNVLKKLGIIKKQEDIAIIIDTSTNNIYNSVNYEVPQRRKRFICGDFPQPKQKTHDKDSWIPLRKVINALKEGKTKVIDPNYGFVINQEHLTDHPYDTIIPRFEWEEARIKKEQARYYGKMSFPENESVPSRTVMATRSVLSRESMILPNGSRGNYRAPTIREVASLMSFPITYLFQANNEASKYRLVGNAVCPKLSFAFAEAIMDAEKKRVEYSPNPHSDRLKLTVNLRKSPPPLKKARDKQILTGFAEIVPNLKYKNFRVELDNNFPKLNNGKVIWSASIHHATGKDSMKVAKPSMREIKAIFNTFPKKDKISNFIKDINSLFNGNIPPSNKFQEQHCFSKHDRIFLTPRQALKKIKSITNKHFPEKTYKDVIVSNIKNHKPKSKYIRFNRGSPPEDMIPLRMLAALYGVTYISSLTNNKRDKQK